ncbi:MAG: ornithine cyclodeaminase/alanine dehydrogenase-like protein (mu-crystallin family) [Cyclobacteriaceae bacterium]|jgi:ornithine cyclodeaminase/alanine dehydrogenase-like protein (mu-crystallin family)
MFKEDMIKNNRTLILTQGDIQQIASIVGINDIMGELIGQLKEALVNFDPNKTQIPARSGFNYTEPNTGLIEWMPLYEKGDEVVIKLVGYHPSNPTKYKLPTIISSLSAYDTKTGHLLGLMDGVLPTALRTGAASAVATELLAKPESRTLGLIGCGAQSVTQIHAISCFFSLKHIYVYDIDTANAKSLQKRCSAINLEAEIKMASLEKVVSEADILCTATSIGVGQGPLFDNINTKDHIHINALGSDFPGKTELPLSLLKRSFVCPDFVDQSIVEGECQQLEESEIGPDWIEIIKNPQRYQNYQSMRTVFDSTGWALEDKVVMDLFLNYAKELNIGQFLDIEMLPKDALNPYEFIKQESAWLKNVNF